VDAVKPVWLQGGWPDDARGVVHRAALRRIVGTEPLRGACLNAGCGEGLFAGFLESFPAITRIVHMDIDHRPIAPGRADARHQDCRGSVTVIPFGDATFASVLCTEVLEHVPDDQRAFAELARVTEPGGWLVISGPTPPAPDDPAHVREGYTLSEMTAHLDRCGCEVVRSLTCFHVTLRATMAFWRWQYRVLGRGRRSVMPRVLLVVAGHLDRVLPLGRPWDLVVLARRR